jgi:plasmid stability protein
MNLTIELPEDLASTLRQEAGRRGIEAQPLAVQILRENLSATERSRSLQELFAQ